MNATWSGTAFRRAMTVTCGLLIGLPASFAQAPADPMSVLPDAQQSAPLLSPEQLSNLVAPIALYPDPLLSQVLAASTYPLEIVQLQQWMSQNGNLQGAQLMEAARGQNWDPSVQALVAFPDALALLANDIRWTSDLGNAFLAQQSDVMSAVQLMRSRARDNGRLTTTPQQVVRVEAQNGQDAIEILPADPQVIYVPIYRPAYVWGPPVWGAYPDLWYPASYGGGYGFGSGLYMSAYFPSWGGWGGWGWNCGWYGGGLSINIGFFNRYGFGGGYYGRSGYYSNHGYGGRSSWMHDPGHRMGIPYNNRNVASRFGGNDRMNRGYSSDRGRNGSSQWNGGRSDSGRQGYSPSNRGGSRADSGSRSGSSGGWQRFGDGNRSGSTGRSDSRGFVGSDNSGARTSGRGSDSSRSYRNQSSQDRSYSTGSTAARGGRTSDGRSYSSPSQNYSSPRSSSGSSNSGWGRSSESRSYSSPSQNYSSPRSSSGSSNSGWGRSSESRSYSSPSQSYSSPRSSGGNSGFSQGRSSGNSGFSQSRSSGNSSFSGGGRSGGGSGSSGGRSGGGGGGRQR